jgi:TP901 family phage tail tape measure protein
MDATLGRLTVDILGNLNPLNAALASARSSLRSFAGLGSSLTRMLGFGMAAGVGASVKAAIDLEATYSQLRKTTGLTGVELEALKGKLQSIATTMAGVSLGDVNDIAVMAGRLGITGVGAIGQFTESIAKIKIALDDIPAEEAATHIAKMLNQFGLGVGDVERFGSALNKLDDSSTASGREILDVTRRLSGAAATMKMTAAETLALGTTIIDAGIHAEVGGTAVSRLIGKMATDTKKMAAVAGVSTEEFAAAFKGSPIRALQMFGEGMAKMAPEERLKALKDLKFGGAQTGMPLLQLVNILPRLATNLATANREWGTMASLNAEVAIQAGTTKAQLQLLWNNIVLGASAFGDRFLPAIRVVTGALPAIQSAFADLAATPYAAQFAENVSMGFGSMAEFVQSAIDTVVASIRNWDLILEDAGLRVEQALVNVGDVFGFLRDSAGVFLDWFGANWASIIGDAIRVTIGFLDNFKNYFIGVFNALQAAFTAGSLEEALAGLAGAVMTPLDVARGAIKTAAPDMPSLEFRDTTSDRRAALAEEMLARERAAQDKAKGAKAEGGDQKIPGQPGEEATGLAPGGGSKKSPFMALQDLSKSLQEGALKGGPEERTAKGVEQMVGLQQQAVDLQKAAMNKPPMPGIAAA